VARPPKRGKKAPKAPTARSVPKGIPTGKAPTSMPIRQMAPMTPPQGITQGDPAQSLQAAIGESMIKRR
jgi:hypothetical protein